MDYRDNANPEARAWRWFTEERPNLATIRIVCPTCDGRGSYVDPDVDRNGLTADDFDYYGEDFEEGYRSGAYDVRCERCDGRNVVDYPAKPEDVKEWEAELESLWRDLAYEAAERRAGC